MQKVPARLSSTHFFCKVFAPTDQAFNKLGAANLDSLQSDAERTTLESLLSRHIVLTTVPSAMLAEGTATFQTLNPNESLSVAKYGNTLVLNNVTSVVETDALANNGIVHLIDTIIPLNVADTPTASPNLLTEKPTADGTAHTDATSAPASGSRPCYLLWSCALVLCFTLWGWARG